MPNYLGIIIPPGYELRETEAPQFARRYLGVKRMAHVVRTRTMRSLCGKYAGQWSPASTFQQHDCSACLRAVRSPTLPQEPLNKEIR